MFIHPIQNHSRLHFLGARGKRSTETSQSAESQPENKGDQFQQNRVPVQNFYTGEVNPFELTHWDFNHPKVKVDAKDVEAFFERNGYIGRDPTGLRMLKRDPTFRELIAHSPYGTWVYLTTTEAGQKAWNKAKQQDEIEKSRRKGESQ